jgi:hypothetical protein
MQRTQISLSDSERSLLDRVASETGLSIAALIRNAVHVAYGRERSAQEDIAAMRQAFGLWSNRAETGAEYVEKIRSGRRLSHS